MEIRTVSDHFSVQKGFSDQLRPSAAKLYDMAFKAKLSIAIPGTSQRRAVLEKGFNPEFSFVAMNGGELVGIAGFQTAQGSLTGGISFRLMRGELGYWGAIRATPVLAMFHRVLNSGQLLMDGIGVSPAMRGKGIGTMLLQRLFEHAEAEGYRSVRLDVINTNDGARRLYERMGFKAVKTEQFACLKWLFGFSAATQMEYQLGT